MKELSYINTFVPKNNLLVILKFSLASKPALVNDILECIFPCILP